MRNSDSSLNMLYTAERTQFHSPFLQTAISLTGAVTENAKFDFAFFAIDSQNNPKMLSCEDDAKFHSAFFLVIALSSAAHFQ
jgi:hypothetical protein